jgi:hypothetical protein
METLLSIISGGIGGAVLTALLRGWITERLKQSIQHEYAQKLENHKSELNTKLQAISHENQLNQLRTSLFFDHQREAFAKVLTTITQAANEWWETYDPEEGLVKPVPLEAYKGVKRAYYEHRLFLDGDCICAIKLVLEVMSDSFPFDDGSGQLHYRDCRAPSEAFDFLQDRLPELFQEKIGIRVIGPAKKDIALFGAVRLLNRYHFSEIGLPPKDALKLTLDDSPGDVVRKAQENTAELIKKMTEFREYLRRDASCFHEAETKICRYLRMLGHAGTEMEDA